MEQGFEYWILVVIGYSTTTNPPTDVVWRMITNNNAKAMNAILSGLICYNFMKVMQCELAKEMWDKLQAIYEGDEKGKEAKS